MNDTVTAGARSNDTESPVHMTEVITRAAQERPSSPEQCWTARCQPVPSGHGRGCRGCRGCDGGSARRVDSSAGTLIARAVDGSVNGAPAAMAEGSNSATWPVGSGQHATINADDTDDRRDEHDDTGATTSPRRAVPHRVLDQPERRVREHDRHGDAHTEQRHPVEPRPVRH